MLFRKRFKTHCLQDLKGATKIQYSTIELTNIYPLRCIESPNRAHCSYWWSIWSNGWFCFIYNNSCVADIWCTYYRITRRYVHKVRNRMLFYCGAHSFCNKWCGLVCYPDWRCLREHF